MSRRATRGDRLIVVLFVIGLVAVVGWIAMVLAHTAA
jgi:hypothetical protein